MTDLVSARITSTRGPWSAVTIVGCGYVGRRVAQRWQDRGVGVTGLVCSAESAARLRHDGIEPMIADLDVDSVSRSWPVAASLLYYFVPPPRTGTVDTRLPRFLDTLNGNTDMRLVLISTTGVYGDCAGRWIDETEPPRPATDRARRRLDAERSAQRWGRRNGVPVVVLRVSGIYGPGRIPIARLRRGMLVPEVAQSPFTNRIHVDDLVTACVAAAAKGVPGSVFNVTDGAPERMTDYFLKVAAITGVAPPQVTSLTEAQRAASPGLSAYFAESRRIGNAKLRTELGVELRYPNLDSGLAACIDSCTLSS